jgi:DNA-binding response OmpR family regulator
MPSILVIDESPLIREYLSSQLGVLGFEVILAVNGLDGLAKMKNQMPDIVLMDYYLTRKSSIEILESKLQDRNIQNTPVILMATKLGKEAVVGLGKLKVTKIMFKPLRMEALTKAISDLTGIKIAADETPCIIEAHFNDEILFIEIARGLNRHKIEQLRYKITELLELYQVRIPKVLIMMTDVELGPQGHSKLMNLFAIIMNHAQSNTRLIRVLTGSREIAEIIANESKLKGIQATPQLEQAMEGLLGTKHDQGDHQEDAVHRVLSSTAPKKEGTELIRLGYEEQGGSGILSEQLEIAVVDDDPVITELVKTIFSQSKWKLHTYENGKLFAQDINNHDFSLVFLDLMMPEMNGFQVLEYMKKIKSEIPVIVFSALSRQESVVKAVSYGIKSYMIKPLKPKQVLQKTAEVLSLSF